MTAAQRASITSPAKHGGSPLPHNAELVSTFTLSGREHVTVHRVASGGGTEVYWIRWEGWESLTVNGQAAIKFAAERVGWSL
jgi:hypothetical protein